MQDFAGRVAKIEALYLDPIKVKLMDTEEGNGWSRLQCDAAEKWYKRFLVLNLLYENEAIVPTKEIDEFWHYHILDTEKYAEDCQNTFGYFLHHFPYFGMRGEEDAKDLERSFARTQELFVHEFGESLSELRSIFSLGDAEGAAKCDGSHCGAKDCSKCGKSCSGAKCTPSSRPPGVDYSIRPSL